MSLGMILLIVLILLLLGAFPRWGYSRNWGYGPSGGLGLVLVIVLILVLLGAHLRNLDPVCPWRLQRARHACLANPQRSRCEAWGGPSSR